ncbi:hypothetical protein QAD02_022698 [Eretmocerus hayati]|uniref:Uncharacterized protein n=1 Tax=Eretmocerus hayati TaxID=131215 RepID=A0ACC2PTI8_9HYME|nr:hypothetical protein QAD02_022698 [Eretmocerus hayati]
MKKILKQAKDEAATPESFVELYKNAVKTVEQESNDLYKNLTESYETVKDLKKKFNTTWNLEQIQNEKEEFYGTEKDHMKKDLMDFKRRVDRRLEKMIRNDDIDVTFVLLIDEIKTKNYGNGKTFENKEAIMKKAKTKYELKRVKLLKIKDARRKLLEIEDLNNNRRRLKNIEKLYSRRLQRLDNKFEELKNKMKEE